MSEDQSIVMSVCPPKSCSADQLTAFKRMVIEGGEVSRATLATLVDRALVIAFARAAGVLVGVGAIKRPHDTHRKRVFLGAKSLLNPSHFDFELGWVCVDSAHRGKGLASRLVESLTLSLKGAAVYATSRVNNDRMHSSLRRFGFKTEGLPYPSRVNAPEIQLFVRK